MSSSSGNPESAAAPAAPGSPAEPPPAQRAPRGLRIGRALRRLNILAVLLVIATAAGLLLSPSEDDPLLGLPALSIGERAPRTVKSPRDYAIADPETTTRLRDEAGRVVRPTYDLITGHGLEAKQRIEDAFGVMTAPQRPDAGPHSEALLAQIYRERAEDFMRALDTYFEDKDLDLLIRGGFSDEVRDAAIMVIRTIYEQKIADDKELLKLQAPGGVQLRILGPTGRLEKEQLLNEYAEVTGIDEARARIDEIIAGKLGHLTPEARRAIALIAKRQLRPNLEQNRQDTELRSSQARGAVKAVVIPIKAGEVVLRAGETVTERHLVILRGMAQAHEGRGHLSAPAGSAALIVLLVLGVYRLYRRERRSFLPEHRDLALWASVYIGTLLLLWIGYQGSIWAHEMIPGIEVRTVRYLIPIAWSTLLLRVVMRIEVAAAFVPLAALTAGWMMNTSLGYAAYVLLGSLAAASVPVGRRPRATLLSAGVWCGVVQSAAAIALAMLESYVAPIDLALDVGAALGSGMLAALVVAILIPMVEVILGYTTPFKLWDLLNLNHPLLRDLLVQAPGSYHHSIVVGRLSEAAARAVGADPILSRVGGYYHDIGKIKNPRVFDENHRGAFTASAPPEQAAEIKLHVAEGLELGAKHRLGEPILEIIAQHHGTGIVREAKQRAIDQKGAPLTPLEAAQYAYAGPKPLTREAGLVMLADSVESAIESLVSEMPLGEEAIEANIRRVIQELVNDGQLDGCELTMADVHKVTGVFIGEFKEMLARRGQSVPSQLPQVSARLVRPPSMEKPN